MTATWNFIKTKQQSLGQPAHLGCKIAILDILTMELRKIRGAVFVLKTWVKGSVHQKKKKEEENGLHLVVYSSAGISCLLLKLVLSKLLV